MRINENHRKVMEKSIENDEEISSSNALKSAAKALGEPAFGSASPSRRDVRPASSAVHYDGYGNAVPSKAVKALPGQNEDMRYLDGAPRAWETVNAMEPVSKEPTRSRRPRSFLSAKGFEKASKHLTTRPKQAPKST